MGARIHHPEASRIRRAQQQAAICKVFSNANRVLIAWTLNEGEMSVGEIAEAIGTSLQNTSQHLQLMKERGVLDSRRQGHVIYYRIANHAPLPGCPVLSGVRCDRAS